MKPSGSHSRKRFLTQRQKNHNTIQSHAQKVVRLLKNQSNRLIYVDSHLRISSNIAIYYLPLGGLPPPQLQMAALSVSVYFPQPRSINSVKTGASKKRPLPNSSPCNGSCTLTKPAGRWTVNPVTPGSSPAPCMYCFAVASAGQRRSDQLDSEKPEHEATFIRLQNELADNVEELFVFVIHPQVEPTNNISECHVRREAEIRKGGVPVKRPTGLSAAASS